MIDVRNLLAHSNASYGKLPTSVDKRFIKLTLLIALLFAFKFASFAWWVTPLWDIPDESGHYSYVQSLAAGQYPVLGEARMGLDVTHSWRGPKAKPGLNWIAQHPPLYYAMGVPFLKVAQATGADLDAQVRSVRLLSALLGALTLVGLAWFLVVATGNETAALAATILVAATPMFTHLSTGVTHDPLVACLAAWAAYWCVIWLRSGRLPHLLYCSALVGLGVITKITSLAMAAPFFFCMAWMIWMQCRKSHEHWRHFIKAATAAWLLMFVPLCLWFTRNLLTYGSLMPDASTIASTKLVAIGFMDLMRSYPFWQHTWLNFIALVGWNGSSDGSLKWIQASGVLATYFSIVFAVPAAMASAGPLPAMVSTRVRTAMFLCGSVLVIAMYLRWPLHTVAWRTCLLILLASLVTLAFHFRDAMRGQPSAWLLVTCSFCFVVFAGIYYHHLWASFTGTMRATHGRYFYPVLPMLMLVLTWPMRWQLASRSMLTAAVLAMVVTDGFYLHQAFGLFNLL